METARSRSGQIAGDSDFSLWSSSVFVIFDWIKSRLIQTALIQYQFGFARCDYSVLKGGSRCNIIGRGSSIAIDNNNNENEIDGDRV
mmetsp:Transcript_2747/g.5933  ORF Transcript_2747/g.5933 Transcript_2747/m.5933 type:complete len:87 (-) Transcript_2747:47-307(-)